MARETVSDSLFTAMIPKGLPFEFKTFLTTESQKEKPIILTDFKVELKIFEETKRCHISHVSDSVINLKHKHSSWKNGSDGMVKCYSWGRLRHKSFEYTNTDLQKNKG